MLPGYQGWPEEVAERYRQEGCWKELRLERCSVSVLIYMAIG